MPLWILDPTVTAEPAEVRLARRAPDLDGKVLGLLANGKVNGDLLLDLVREGLTARYRFRDVVVMAKANASRPGDDAMIGALARECDAVVTAIGGLLQHVQFARRDRAGAAGRTDGRDLHGGIHPEREGAGGELG